MELLKKKCVSIKRGESCYYTASGIQECLSEYPSNLKYHNVGYYQCLSSCNNDKFPYLRESGTVCYKSCDLIPDLGKNYFISSGNLCTCIICI